VPKLAVSAQRTAWEGGGRAGEITCVRPCSQLTAYYTDTHCVFGSSHAAAWPTQRQQRRDQPPGADGSWSSLTMSPQPDEAANSSIVSMIKLGNDLKALRVRCAKVGWRGADDRCGCLSDGLSDRQWCLHAGRCFHTPLTMCSATSWHHLAVAAASAAATVSAAATSRHLLITVAPALGAGA
jgi:hypothetical protein